jgi:hypothetical protein
MDSSSELRCRIAARLWELKQFPFFQKYKILTEWLDCYQYILPQDRELGPAITATINGPHNCYLLWQFIDLLYNCLTYAEQEYVWKLISESSISVIHPY